MDMRPADRPTKKIPEEILRGLIQASRTEDEQWVSEWESGEGPTANLSQQEEDKSAADDVP